MKRKCICRLVTCSVFVIWVLHSAYTVFTVWHGDTNWTLCYISKFQNSFPRIAPCSVPCPTNTRLGDVYRSFTNIFEHKSFIGAPEWRSGIVVKLSLSSVNSVFFSEGLRLVRLTQTSDNAKWILFGRNKTPLSCLQQINVRVIIKVSQ